jgi:hypothetical protein
VTRAAGDDELQVVGLDAAENLGIPGLVGEFEEVEVGIGFLIADC